MQDAHRVSGCSRAQLGAAGPCCHQPWPPTSPAPYFQHHPALLGAAHSLCLISPESRRRLCCTHNMCTQFPQVTFPWEKLAPKSTPAAHHSMAEHRQPQTRRAVGGMAAAQPRAGHSQQHWHAAVASKGLACCWQALNRHRDRRGQANRFKRGHWRMFPCD